MSDNFHEDNRPTPDKGSAQEMETFFQEQFKQWDREEEEAARPPEEEVDANGFRVLTLNVGHRKQGRHVMRPLLEHDEEEDALEAMLEANSNKSEKVTFLPFVPRPVEEREAPPASDEEEQTPEPPAVHTPQRLRVDPIPAQAPESSEPEVPEAEEAAAEEAAAEEPAAKKPETEEPAAVAPAAEEPTAAAPAAEEPTAAAPGAEEPAASQQDSPPPAPVHMPKRLRVIKPEPVMVRLESEEDEEEEPLTPPPAPQQEPDEAQRASGSAPVQQTEAPQAEKPSKPAPKAAKPSPEDLQEQEEEALEQELEERAARPGIMDKLFGSWFEERMEGQQRQMDTDAEYEQEHASEHTGTTQSFRLPRLPQKKRRSKWAKAKQAAQGSAAQEPSAAQLSPEQAPKAGTTKASRNTKPLSEKPGKVTKAPNKPADNVIRMTEEQHPSGLISKKLSAIREQADEFADAMFVSESAQRQEEEAEQARVAQFIPATDVEEEARPKDLAREERRRKKEERQRYAPDTSPKELFRTYSSSYKSRRARLNAQFFIAAALLLLTALASGELTFLRIQALQENLRFTALVQTLGLALACIVGLDTLLEGVIGLLRGRPSLSTLSSLGAVLTVADGVWYSAFGRQGPLPFCGFAALSLWAIALGHCRKTQGLRDACEDAYTRSEYERVTMDEGMWSGKGVYRKEPGGPQHFGSQIQEPDGAEQVYRYAAPVMMALCTIFGVFAAVAQKAPQMVLWNWSVIFIMATPLSATLAYGMPYARQVRRLRSSGVVLAGWDGAESLRSEAGIVLTDRDLFPEGTVQMVGIQNFGDISLEKVTGCTASLVRQADLGIAKLFDDQLRMQGGFYRRVDQMETSEESGCTGVLRGDTVMIGTAGYLQVHGIDIEPGYQVKNAVFCSINGTLRGIFALRYEMPRGVQPAIHTLLQGGISPILATRDFNITPEVLHTRFKLPSERLQYPPVERRYDLSAKDNHHNRTLGALLFREGINPYIDAILGGRRLCAVVRLNTMLTLLASVLGALLGLYLTSMNAFYSLSLLNTLFFLLMWLVPTVLVSRGVDQF